MFELSYSLNYKIDSRDLMNIVPDSRTGALIHSAFICATLTSARTSIRRVRAILSKPVDNENRIPAYLSVAF